jgi:hypothetical protein
MALDKALKKLGFRSKMGSFGNSSREWFCRGWLSDSDMERNAFLIPAIALEGVEV